MIQAVNTSKKDKWSDLIINSIGVCVAMPEEKKSSPCIIVAYMSGADKKVALLTMPLPPKNKLYTAEDFLQAIRSAEGTRHVTYMTTAGETKDIYFCRQTVGKMIDVIPRDYKNNTYEAGFAEICAKGLKFTIQEGATPISWKPGKALDLHITAHLECAYTEGSYEYAALNAYNACLLGAVFEREELQLETKHGKRARFEVREELPKFLNEDILYVVPVAREKLNTVDYYETEEFHYIDGEDTYTRKYKIIYSNRLGDYNVVRS